MTIASSRKFRAIRLWFMMKWFGKEGMIESSRQHLGKSYEGLIQYNTVYF